jgi:hypothetical protein
LVKTLNKEKQMKINTAELTGAALDWAVAMCEGWQYTTARDNTGQYPWLVKVGKDIDPKQYRPSSNWAQGGPIIEREWVSLWQVGRNYWKADKGGLHSAQSETPLIAAMRCYVASKKGDEVDVTEEIVL